MGQSMSESELGSNGHVLVGHEKTLPVELQSLLLEEREELSTLVLVDGQGLGGINREEFFERGRRLARLHHGLEG